MVLKPDGTQAIKQKHTSGPRLRLLATLATTNVIIRPSHPSFHHLYPTGSIDLTIYDPDHRLYISHEVGVTSKTELFVGNISKSGPPSYNENRHRDQLVIVDYLCP